MKKSRLGKEALTLSIMTVVTVVLWIAFDVYHAATKATKTKVTAEQLAPLDSRLNKETITNLKESLYFTEEEMNLESQPTEEPVATESSPIDTVSNPDTML